MKESKQKFGQLLTEGLYQIKLREAKPLAVIQDELGYSIGRDTGGSSLAHWRRGNIPASYAELETLVREIVKRGNLEKSWVEQLFAATEYSAEAMCAALFPESETSPIPSRTIHALPGKDYRQLVGREQLKEKIITILASPDMPNMVSIDGQGGIGKTALALDIADLCQRRSLFADFIWLGSPRLYGSSSQVENRFTLETVLDAIGNQLGEDVFADVSLTEKKQLVRDYLMSNRILIILDNLETAVQPQDEIVTQLQPLLGQSKVILTSRHRFRNNTYSIHLTEGCA